ncbi:MAG: glycosyl hydrolase family 28 protein [Saccharofermentanales bacterium]
MLKKTMSLLLSIYMLLFCFGTSGCKRLAAAIVTYENTPGAVQSSVFTAKAGKTDIFVESFQAIDYIRLAAGEDGLALEITASENINKYKISPSTGKVPTGESDGGILKILIPSVPYHGVIEINELRLICIFIDPIEQNPPKLSDTNVVDVMDFVTDNAGGTDQRANIADAIDYVCGTQGKDTLYFPGGTYLISPLLINDKTGLNIYLDDGALIKAAVADPTPAGPTVKFQGCKNCGITGRGVIDNMGREQFDLNGAAGSKNGITVQACSYMTFKDFINRNANTWQFANNDVSHSTYYNVKDVCTEAGVPYSTDGFSVHNSHDVTADYIFAMSRDDMLIVSADSYGNSRPCHNVTVDHFAGYGIGANCIAIGCTPYPGDNVSNITIQNSHFRMATWDGDLSWWYQMPIKIETGPTYYENIRFKNIKFDNNRKDRPFITTQSWPDGVDSFIFVKGDLEISDCDFENQTFASILGDKDRKIENLIIHNLKLGGKIIESIKDADIKVSGIESINFTK